MDENNDDYENRLENFLRRLLKILNQKLSLDLKDELIKESIQFFRDILDLIKTQNGNEKLEIFKEKIPVKKLEYLGAALLYFLLNYKKNPIKIKISEYANITNLARQNIRKMLKFLASFDEILQKYNLTYNPRRTYNFDESEYMSQINVYISKLYNQLVKNQHISVRNIKAQVEDIKNIINNAISSVKKPTIREKTIAFYNSLDKRVRNPKFIAAVACYIYLRFLNHKYIKQEEFVKILNKIDNINLTFDSFSRAYSNFSQNYLIIDQESYFAKISVWLDKYIKKINSNSEFHLELTKDFRSRAIKLLNKAIEKGFDIQESSKDKFAFAQSKKLLPEYIAACLIYLTLKSYKDLEDYATRDYMKKFLDKDLDYSRITSNQSPLYNYVSESLGRYKFQPYSIEDFQKIIRKHINFYNDIKSPHYESVLIFQIFNYSGLNPSEFAKKLNIHGGTTKDLLKIVIKMKNFEDLSVLRKIKEFIQLYIPQDNRKKAIQAYKEYRVLWNQISHIGKSEEICRKIFESIFKTQFKKSYPKWLKSEKGGQMHLDGYNSDLKIAFEYQGKQHYFFIPKWHQTIEIFKHRQADDKWKKELCNMNNIILIEVPYWVKYEEMLDYIINELRNRGITLSDCSQSRKRDYFLK